MFDLYTILSQFPLFSKLSKEQLQEIAKLNYLKEYKKDQIIYEENSCADNLYVVITGKIKTYTQSSLNQGKILEYLYKGTCFGLISLLTEQPHSVTAQAVTNAYILTLPKEEFSQLLNHHPSLAIEFSKILSRRVKKRAGQDKSIFESNTITIYSTEEKIGKTTYSIMLAKALKEESQKKVIFLEIRNQDNGFTATLDKKPLKIESVQENQFLENLNTLWQIDYLQLIYTPDSTQDKINNLTAILNTLPQLYNFIILDLPSCYDALISEALSQSNKVHIISRKDPNSILQTENFISSLLKENKGLKINLFTMITCDLSHPLENYNPNLDIFANLPFDNQNDITNLIQTYPNSLYAKALRRIAREIADVRIGLALGSGAAFGLAHIGVLKVIEELKIPIDVVSGSSIGSIIAGLWGLGYPWEEIKTRMKNFRSFPEFRFLDLGFPGKSFFRGSTLERSIKNIFTNTTFYDLKRPILVVAFDFFKKEPVIFSKGQTSLYTALRASCAIPGVFKPMQIENGLFLDGGILNPLPVNALIKQGVKKIITVNVTPSKEEILQNYAQGKIKKKPSLLDFIFGSIEAMQREIANDAISLSDILIHPQFKDTDWTNFDNINYFIKQGETATKGCSHQLMKLSQNL